MNVRLPVPGLSGLIDLANEPPFRVGPVEITPGLLQLRHGGTQTTLEPRVMQVLTLLARRPGEVVSRDELVATCWSGRFVSEDAIQRTIAKLRRHARADAASAFGIETVPRVGYCLVVGTAPSAAAGVPPRRISWRLGVAGAILLAVAVAGALAWRALAPQGGPASVTLGEFRALGPGVPADLPAGFAESLRDAFGENNDIALTSAGADYVLHGVIQRVGDNLRYSMRLDDSRRKALVWASSPELPAADDYAHRRMAVTLSEVVRCGLIGAGEYPGRLPGHTLGLYLQNCDARAGVGANGNRALALARRAVAETPDFSRGWSAVAHGAAMLHRNAPLAQKPAYAKVVHKAAARALKLDPKNGEAWEVQSYILPVHAYAAREGLLGRAVAGHLSGCGCELSSMGNFLNSVGRTREALSFYRRAYDRQPMYPPASIGLGITYDDLGQWQAADDVWVRLVQTRGPLPNQWIALHASYRGDWSGAKRLPATLAPPPLRAGVDAAFDALTSGDPRRIAAARPVLDAAAAARPSNFVLAEALVASGDTDAALRQLSRIVAAGSTSVLFKSRQRALSHDPRYAALVERSGLIDYWTRSGTRPDLCGEPNPPPFCRTLARPGQGKRGS